LHLVHYVKMIQQNSTSIHFSWQFGDVSFEALSLLPSVAAYLLIKLAGQGLHGNSDFKLEDFQDTSRIRSRESPVHRHSPYP
jgi:hypothetical protein